VIELRLSDRLFHHCKILGTASPTPKHSRTLNDEKRDEQQQDQRWPLAHNLYAVCSGSLTGSGPLQAQWSVRCSVKTGVCTSICGTTNHNLKLSTSLSLSVAWHFITTVWTQMMKFPTAYHLLFPRQFSALTHIYTAVSLLQLTSHEISELDFHRALVRHNNNLRPAVANKSTFTLLRAPCYYMSAIKWLSVLVIVQRDF